MRKLTDLDMIIADPDALMGAALAEADEAQQIESELPVGIRETQRTTLLRWLA